MEYTQNKITDGIDKIQSYTRAPNVVSFAISETTILPSIYISYNK